MPTRFQWWRDRLRLVPLRLVLARGRDVLLSRIRHYSTSTSALSSAQGNNIKTHCLVLSTQVCDLGVVPHAKAIQTAKEEAAKMNVAVYISDPINDQPLFKVLPSGRVLTNG